MVHESPRGNRFIHGYAGPKKHPIYRSWAGARSRCYNLNNPAYADYGGRGITLSTIWDNFESFLTDMGDTWSSGLTLERIDNSKGYSVDNCRWATRKEQSRNRRKASNLPLGVRVTKRGRYTASVGIGTFDTPEEASAAYKAAIDLLDA